MRFSVAPPGVPSTVLNTLPAGRTVLAAVVSGTFTYAVLRRVVPSGLMPRATDSAIGTLIGPVPAGPRHSTLILVTTPRPAIALCASATPTTPHTAPRASICERPDEISGLTWIVAGAVPGSTAVSTVSAPGPVRRTTLRVLGSVGSCRTPSMLVSWTGKSPAGSIGPKLTASRTVARLPVSLPPRV